MNVKWSMIDRWGTHEFLVKTFAEKIVAELKEFPESIRSTVVIIFSAHSLPIKVIVVSGHSVLGLIHCSS